MRVERASLGRSRESMATSASSGVFEEEAKGVIKSGPMQGGFTPFKKKGKHYYVVLSERAMEIYDDEKSYNKKKPSKFTIDLAIAFNVHNEHFHPPLGKCVCVMAPDSTLVLHSGDEKMNQEWFDAILSTACPARALRLGRMVQPTEFFEFVYDVNIVDTPVFPTKAQKKGETEAKTPNIIAKDKRVEGARRLCLYAHTVVLALRGVEPGKEENIPKSGVPPFRPEHFVEIQRKFVPSFGYRDNYFILILGRGAPQGHCELWAECENRQVAEHIHFTLNAIIDRENEKRKKMNGGMPQMVPSIPNLPSTSTSHRHRERAHTQPHRARLPSELLARAESGPLAGLTRKTSTGAAACMANSYKNPPTTSSVMGDHSNGSSMSSLVSGGGGATPTGVPSYRHSFAGTAEQKSKLVPPHGSVFPPRRESGTIKEESSLYQPMDPTDERRKEWEEIMSRETGVKMGNGKSVRSFRAASPAAVSIEETEDSGGTLKCFDETEDSGGTIKLANSRPHTPSGQSIRNLSMSMQSPRQFVPIIPNKADHLSSSGDDDVDVDVISAGTNTSTDAGSAGGESMGEDYAAMEVATWSAESTLSVPTAYKHDTPRSFVSSSDSCYSSMAERQRVGPILNYRDAHHHNHGRDHHHHHHHDASTPLGPPSSGAQFRTYSFGPGHPSFTRPTDIARPTTAAAAAEQSSRLTSQSGDGVVASSSSGAASGEGEAAKEEARKRAFSLGSKHFFASFSRPFRKISSHRAARQSATSASGASLASTHSHASSGGGGVLPSNSASSNHIAALGGGGPLMAERDEYRNRSGSFGSGRSTPYSRRSGGAHSEVDKDHLMELDFGGGGGAGHHGLGRCGSGSINSVDSPSRSRTSSFGCQIPPKREEVDAETGLTPSQLLLQRAKAMSVEDPTAATAAQPPQDGSDYVLTEAPSTTAFRQQAAAAAAVAAVAQPTVAIYNPLAYHPQQQVSLAPPPAATQSFPGGVMDVMGKSHDARNSQYFETIEETTSGRSSRASSIDDEKRDCVEEDEYAMMDCSSSGLQAAAAAAPPPQQPQLHQERMLGGEMGAARTSSRSRSASPAASTTRRVDSSSTLQSVASDRSCSSRKEIVAAAAPAAAMERLQLQPMRPKMSTQSDAGPSFSSTPPSLLTAPLGIPKRSSVPVLKDQAREEAREAGGGGVETTPLNYAFLQLNNTTPSTSTTSSDNRSRSKSGIIFHGSSSSSGPAACAAAAAVPLSAAGDSAAAADHVEYSLFKPLQ